MIVLITPVISKNFETILTILTQRANLVPCHLLFLLILRGWEARRNPWLHSIMFRTWCHALALSSFNQIAPIIHVVNIFVLLLFFTSAVSKQNSFSITGIKVMISGIDFDRPNCLSCLRVFPYDCFKIFTVVPIVRDRTQVYPRDQGHPSHLGHLSSPR